MNGLGALFVLLFCAVITSVYSFNVEFSSKRSHLRSSLTLLAKKGKKGGKGFGSSNAKTTETAAVIDVSVANNPKNEKSNGSPMIQTDEVDKEELTDAEAVFRKYGINTDSKEARAKAAKQVQEKVGSSEPVFGEKVMANISMKDQAKADQILVTGTFLTLSYVVISGIGMSVTALKVVFPTVEIPSLIETLVTDVLTPSFTPALGVFFFFSITFGLFKFAQVSSSQTLYTE